MTRRSPQPSRAVRALAWFGLTPGDLTRLRKHETRHAALIARRVLARHPALTLMVGPSGSGKSTILRALDRALTRRTLAHQHLSLNPSRSSALTSQPTPSILTYEPEAPIVEIPRTTLPGAISLLSRVGLGEARLLALLPSELSDGQLARYRLALALNDALHLRERHGHAWLLIDEFGSGLDQTTRRALALSLSRFSRHRPGLHIVLSTTDDDVLERLAPGALITTRLGRNARAYFRPTASRDSDTHAAHAISTQEAA